MTEKLTTAEVRLAATTNLDLPLTQYKRLESGFDAWLESVKVEAARVALAKVKKSEAKKEPSQSTNDKFAGIELRELTPEEIKNRNKQRSKRGKPLFHSVIVVAAGARKGQIIKAEYREKVFGKKE